MLLKGIDVSKHQGKIDWNKVKKYGIDFAILRIGYGMFENQKDYQFENNYTGALANGIDVGVYVYSYAKNVNEAKQEAECCLRWLNGRKLNLPVYYDIEDVNQKALSKAMRNNMCVAFCDVIEKAGYWAGIYANKNWFTNMLDGNTLGERYTCWVAQYNNKCTYSGPYDMWQYSSSGKVEGINGNVDMNYLYRDLAREISKELPLIRYQVYDKIKRIWLPNVTIGTNDYAGNFGNSISGIYIDDLVYRTHDKVKKIWLPWVAGRSDYAGNLSNAVDGIQIKGVKYRAHLKNGEWLPWVSKVDNTADGYAGILNKEIDAVQIKRI